MNQQDFLSDSTTTLSADSIICSDNLISNNSDGNEPYVIKGNKSLIEILNSFSRTDPKELDEKQFANSQTFLEERIDLAIDSGDRLFYYSYWLISSMVTAYDIASNEEQKRYHERITELLQHHAMLAIAGYLEYDSLSENDQDNLYTTKHEFLTYAWAFTKLWMKFALGDFGLRLLMAYEAEHSDFLIDFIQSFDQSYLNFRGFSNTLPQWVGID